MIAALTDEAKKAKAAKYEPGCKKIYKLASRMRRDQNEDKHFADTYLTWITPEQRAELKTLKDGGATVQALQVVMY
jgi:hypothetical protein